mmetsp:Transcript_58377/g.186099  ORF Transcript_58377/g.186099 Transcript_58377/m.186099 type:complete len:380 (-) Transcript_58377:323-1462(-)
MASFSWGGDPLADITIEVGEQSWNLSKWPLAQKSAFFLKKFTSLVGDGERGKAICLHDLPGGARCFEAAAKWCYGEREEHPAVLLPELICLADFLGMDIEGRSFLDEVLAQLNAKLAPARGVIEVVEILEVLEGALLPHVRLAVEAGAEAAPKLQALAVPGLLTALSKRMGVLLKVSRKNDAALETCMQQMTECLAPTLSWGSEVFEALFRSLESDHGIPADPAYGVLKKQWEQRVSIFGLRYLEKASEEGHRDDDIAASEPPHKRCEAGEDGAGPAAGEQAMLLRGERRAPPAAPAAPAAAAAPAAGSVAALVDAIDFFGLPDEDFVHAVSLTSVSRGALAREVQRKLEAMAKLLAEKAALEAWRANLQSRLCHYCRI